ncbi:hypothetical protein O181_071562 [Austropuccinia psidii MF-1]|uniref:Integrase catalytic domain-containing protein n=1 Tax=Austropuccinia psidii MF-1 TaxID=1389203 RepID=A0A9Q3F5E7_9BASI|nr:hypothetical protein [Austropuccinia psidii MF-1]
MIQLLEESITIEKLTKERFKIIINRETTLHGQIINGLMSVTHDAPKTLMSIGDVWHQSLGHPSNQVARTLGLPPPSDTCETCILGKSVLLPFSSSFEKLVSDKGGEFENKSFSTLAASCGFVHLFAPTSTPEHNGFAKCANCTILDKARCLLLTSNLPRSYWAEAVKTASFLSNVAPTPSRDNLSPYSIWSSKPSRIKRLKTFGCKAFILVHKNKREWKLSPRSEEGILLGFVNDNSAYRILRLRDKVVVITSHALFAEDKFPSLDDKPNVPTCSRWVKISQEDDETFFDCEEIEPEDIDSVNFNDQTDETSPPGEQPELPEGSSSGYPDTHQRIKVIGPRHPTLIQGDSRAISGDESSLWTDAIHKELDAMKRLEVWDIIPLRDDLKLVGTTWVFKREHNAENEVTEYKARLCAQGFLQTFGQDYSKTFGPTGRLHSLRALIAHSVKEKLDFQQLDIRSAFLNAFLQAPLAWYKRLTTWLACSGFTASVSDPCVFFRKTAPPIWLFFHVDDIAVFRTLYGMSDCRPVATPMVPNSHLKEASLEECSAFKALNANYRSAVGSLSYLSVATRPDISFAISSLSQFLEKPGIEHWNGFLQVLRYLRGTADLGLCYALSGDSGLCAYSDADWGNCRQTRRSVNGFVVSFHNCLIIWKTRKQLTVSSSTAEAKYKALTNLSTELLWLRQFVKELSLCQLNGPTTVFDDNQGCISTLFTLKAILLPPSPIIPGKDSTVNFALVNQEAESNSNDADVLTLYHALMEI